MKRIIVILILLIFNPEIYSQRIDENSPKEIIKFSEITEIIEPIYSFENLERIPTNDKCKSKKKKEKQLKCVKHYIGKLAVSNYSETGKTEKLEKGIYRIITKFIIDKEGKIINIQVMFPNEKIRNQAFEKIKNMPNMNPGFKDGNPVFAEYNLQIPFFIY